MNLSMTQTQRLLSFLFHELISPLSSLVTGLDLVDDDPAMLSDVLDILKNASRVLRTRLEYFRSAFGPGGYHLSLAQTQMLIHNWQDMHPEAQVLFETDSTQFDPGVGQSLLLVYLWCVYQHPTAHLKYFERQMSCDINGDRWEVSRILTSLSEHKDSPHPKEMVSLFTHHILSEHCLQSTASDKTG